MPNTIPTLAFFCFWICFYFIIPFIAKRVPQDQEIKTTVAPLRKHYAANIFGNLSLAILALSVPVLNRIPIFGSIHIDLKTSFLAIGFLALDMLCVDPLGWKYSSAEIKKRLLRYVPRKAQERLIWIPVSLVTAVSEEIIYRAVFFGILYQLTGNYWRAGIISAALFALIHRYQGVTALGIAFFVGLGLQYFVKISGGLFVSIAMHFIHNVANGIVYGALAERKLKSEIAENIMANSREIAFTAHQIDKF